MPSCQFIITRSDRYIPRVRDDWLLKLLASGSLDSATQIAWVNTKDKIAARNVIFRTGNLQILFNDLALLFFKVKTKKWQNGNVTLLFFELGVLMGKVQRLYKMVVFFDNFISL